MVLLHSLSTVEEGAEQNLDSTLRFFTSARSAYVSGQVVRVSKGDNVDVDWTQPLGGKTMLVTGASRYRRSHRAYWLVKGLMLSVLDVPQQQADLQRSLARWWLCLNRLTSPVPTRAKKSQKQRKSVRSTDSIIHNAGVTRDKTLAKMDEKKWDMVININLGSIAS